MAYLAFAETPGGLDPILAPAAVQAAEPAAPSLSALEWSVVAIARGDRLSSLRTPGRMSQAMGTLFGPRSNPRLADPRLEALRRVSVLSWHYGYTIPSEDLRAFLAAGYTPAQYELVVDSVGAARRSEQAPRTRH